MTSVWLSPQARERLETELADLMTHSDLDNDAMVEAWLARKARIREIHDLLSTPERQAAFPPDDGVAEPGMVLTVRYEGSDDTETFLLGVRGAEDTDIEVYSPNSPLGQALLGATPGAHREYQLPDGTRQVVTLTAAVPLGVWMSARTG